MRLIDADALVKDGYVLHRTYQQDEKTMVYETKRIEDIPTAQPEPKWIPCSERLPEYYEPVLTWDGHCYFVEKRIPAIKADNGEPIRSDWWVSDDYDEFDSDYYPNLRDGACIAWMPLPEPYREENR